MLLGFGGLGLLTSLFFGRVGEPTLETDVLYRGSNRAGPFVVSAEDPVVNIDLHGGLVADDTWATLRCEVLDAHEETLFAFRDVIWHAEGWEDGHSWVEWDVGIDLDVVLPEGAYTLALFIEEAPGTAPRRGELDEGNIRVEIAPVNGSPVPHLVLGVLAIVSSILAFVGARFVSWPRRRALEITILVGLLALYVGAFLLAAAGYGYTGYGGPEHGPSWWDFGAVPTEHGPGAARGRYPAHLDTLRLDDGSVYAGETQHGKAHGTGRLIEPSGTRTFGQFREGQPHGKVLVRYGEGSELSTYEGTMSHGLLSGEGTLWYRNGDEYAGELHRGARHGTGTLTRSDGQELVGRWEHDEYLGP